MFKIQYWQRRAQKHEEKFLELQKQFTTLESHWLHSQKSYEAELAYYREEGSVENAMYGRTSHQVVQFKAHFEASSTLLANTAEKDMLYSTAGVALKRRLGDEIINYCIENKLIEIRTRVDSPLYPPHPGGPSRYQIGARVCLAGISLDYHIPYVEYYHKLSKT